MFSADYRRAVAAEAAGDYAEAARAYALAGERARVAEMHLLRAERANSPAARLSELRAAVRWADVDERDGKQARRRIARSMLQWARAATLLGDAERQVVREAAQLFGDVGDHTGAGECHELIGDELQAAEAYQRAGDVERLESVLAREEQRRKRESRVRDAFDEYKLALAGGERDKALDAIRYCADAPLAVEKGPGAAERQAELLRERSTYQQLRESLEHQLLADGMVTLLVGRPPHSREKRFVARFPLVLGREATCQLVLRDPGISRHHASITIDDGGRFVIADSGSKNGTRLDGVIIGAPLPLGDAGEIGLGDVCAIAYRVEHDRLTLEVTRGLGRGWLVVAGHGAFDVDGVGELVFIDGRPRLSALGGRLLYLNGVHCGGAVQLISGDVVELGEARLEVVSDAK